MKTEDKQRVADVLVEKPSLIRIGMFVFKMRPLTLAQIYEMGAAANDINVGDLEDTEKRVRIMAALINHHKDAKVMQRVLSSAFSANAGSGFYGDVPSPTS